jgi:hypothetical protein
LKNKSFKKTTLTHPLGENNDGVRCPSGARHPGIRYVTQHAAEASGRREESAYNSKRRRPIAIARAPPPPPTPTRNASSNPKTTKHNTTGLTPPPDAAAGGPPAKKLRLLTLPAPATGAPQAFALSGGAKGDGTAHQPPLLLELSRHKTKHTAWVVGRTALPDGGLVLATPVDPLLVLLPILRPVPCSSAADNDANHEKPLFQDLDALLTDPRWPALGALKGLVRPLLPLICEVKRVGGGGEEEEGDENDDAYYRIDDQRAAAYLRLKAKRAAEALKSCASPAAAALDDSQRLAYALGWLGEWASRAWLEAAGRGLGEDGGRVVPVGLPGGAAAAAAAGGGSAAAAERQRRFGGPGEVKDNDNGGLLQVPGSGAFDGGNKRPAAGDPFDDGAGAGLTEEQKKEMARKKAEDTRERNKQAKMQACASGSRKISSFFSKK